jgi:hypothetical protein
VPVFLIVLLASGSLYVGRASAASCQPGWGLAAEQDNSFTWQSLLSSTATWKGSAQLLEDVDSNCYVHQVKVLYTGPEGGGTLSLTGNPFVSYTVQYPAAFDTYANVARNAVGKLAVTSPVAGDYLTYKVDPRFGINSNGADEYRIEAKGVPALVSGVQIEIYLPLTLLGKTIYAQVHVGTDLCRCTVASFTIPGAPPPPDQIWGVYIHAHQDDWQLWESPDSYARYQAGNRVMFIYVTAGDAGQGAPYWRSREEATKASVQVLAGSGLQGQAGTLSICYLNPSQVCHTLSDWTYGRTISFFMRLPDGGNQGGGFPSTNFETIKKLRDGKIANITAVDGSTKYDGWSDLYFTMAAIVKAYTLYDRTTRINAPDIDRNRQTSQGTICSGCLDHADHLATGDLVYNMTVSISAPWTRVFYIDYPLAFADPRYPVNQDSAGYNIKKQLFMAYSNSVKNQTGVDEYGSQPWFWENAFQREYGREI